MKFDNFWICLYTVRPIIVFNNFIIFNLVWNRAEITENLEKGAVEGAFMILH